MSLYISNLIIIVTMMFLGWLLSVYQKNVTIVDSFWGMGFVLISWLTYLKGDGFMGRALLIALLTTIWGFRLSFYLTLRNHGKEEDPRYASWRKKNSEQFWFISLFKVFLLQAIFLWVISLSMQAGQMSMSPSYITAMDILGTLIWLVGFTFESLGDYQLSQFKSNPENNGRVMSKGLWRYTRHPNYFGESLIWWGIFIISLSSIKNGWSIISPIVITSVLLKMTGIPLTEKLLREKRAGYEEYISTTSSFFPRMPKSIQRKTPVYDENTH